MEHKQTARKSDWEITAIPIALILTGLILVGGDLFGLLSLDRIQNYWPMALISIGLMELTTSEDTRRS